MSGPESPDDRNYLYSLLEFLIQERVKQKSGGLKTPIVFSLKDLGGSLGYGDVDELNIMAIVRLCHSLNTLIFHDKVMVCPDRDKNFFLKGNFLKSYAANKTIKLEYSREELDRHCKELRKDDQLRNANPDKLIFDPSHHKFHFGSKSMWVRQEEHDLPIRINLCLLLFGHPVCDPSDNGEQPDLHGNYPEYIVGADVNYDVLYDLIFTRREEEGPIGDKFRPIRDGIIGLNKRAMDELGINIFEQENQIVRVIQ